MEGFDVATERIATAASGVAQVGSELQQEIRNMETLLGDINAGWHSTSAAPRFTASMQGYLDEARALTQALLSHGDGLTATSRAFDQAEETIASATPVVAA